MGCFQEREKNMLHQCIIVNPKMGFLNMGTWGICGSPNPWVSSILKRSNFYDLRVPYPKSQFFKQEHDGEAIDMRVTPCFPGWDQCQCCLTILRVGLMAVVNVGYSVPRPASGHWVTPWKWKIFVTFMVQRPQKS